MVPAQGLRVGLDDIRGGVLVLREAGGGDERQDVLSGLEPGDFGEPSSPRRMIRKASSASLHRLRRDVRVLVVGSPVRGWIPSRSGPAALDARSAGSGTSTAPMAQVMSRYHIAPPRVHRCARVALNAGQDGVDDGEVKEDDDAEAADPDQGPPAFGESLVDGR